MKNLMRIFCAVVALVAYSCTTDTTEEFGVELGSNGAKTTITLSLESSRTQLGEKVDGLYPLYWSEGDAIAINGTPSSSITVLDGGTAATFSFDALLERPWSVVYPTPAEGVTAVTEGCYPVTFPSAQRYVVGSFDPAAAVMYGYGAAQVSEDSGATEASEGEESSASESVSLKHLTGLLRFAVKGATTLTALTVKSESGDIAGTYDVDCSSGKLYAQEGKTSNTISVSFGDGLQLSADEATPIYVAVPEGEYGTILVTLRTATDKMTVKFSSDVKPIVAGTVREFAEFVYAANTADEDLEFEIYDVATLKEFARIAPTFYPRTTAKVTAAIDMTGEEWTPIENFGGFTFDGGGFEIKGLSAPLFGSTAAVVRNVKLTEVNFASEPTDIRVGAIARVFNGGGLFDSSASGTITVNRESTTLAYFGGLAGAMYEASFTRCTNNVDIVINGNVESGTTYCGGVVGFLRGPLVAVDNCTNNGSITLEGKLGRFLVGGMIGRADACTTFNYCTNNGEILVHAKNVHNQYSIAAGFAAYVDNTSEVDGAVFTLKNSKNTADVTLGAKGGGESTYEAGYVAHASGMLGYTSGFASCTYGLLLEDCENSGDVEINYVDNSNFYRIAGIITAADALCTFTRVTNRGNITLTCSPTGASYMGGLIGQATGSNDNVVSTFDMTDCTNYGKVTVQRNDAAAIYFGGVIGRAEANTKLTMTNCSNEGALTRHDTSAGDHKYCGGMVGSLVSDVSANNKFKLDNCSNTAAITLTGGGARTYFGGMIGWCGSKCDVISNCSNSGSMNISEFVSTDAIYQGGIVGGSGANTEVQVKNCTVSGAINITGTADAPVASGAPYIGGIVGYSSATNGVKLVEGCSCSSKMTFTNFVPVDSSNVSGFGGISSSMVKGMTIKNCSFTGEFNMSGLHKKNYLIYGGLAAQVVDGATISGPDTYCGGKVTINLADRALGNNMMFGGAIGQMLGGSVSGVTISTDAQIDLLSTAARQRFGGFAGRVTAGSVSNIKGDTTRRAKIVYNCGKYSNMFYFGGLIGDCAVALDDCSHNADITFTANNSNESIAKSLYLGGIVGTTTKAVTNSTFSGSIKYEALAAQGEYYIGGIIGSLATAVSCSNLTNNATLDVQYDGSSSNHLGGIIGKGNNALFTDCVNNGDITFGGELTNFWYVGGFMGYSVYSYCTNCANNGDVTYASGSKATANVRMGGFLGYANAPSTTKDWVDVNVRNTGNITIAGTSTKQILLGGVYGYIDADCVTYVGPAYNSGNITITETGGTGSATGFATAVGGIVGTYYAAISNCINTGNLTMKGDSSKSDSTFGGIVGYSTGAGVIKDCQSYSVIDAEGYNYGIITGSARLAEGASTGARLAKVSNCQVGGAISTYDDEDEQYKAKPIPEDTFYNYIYGSGVNTDWTGTTNYDGCTYISTKPTIPALE